MAVSRSGAISVVEQEGRAYLKEPELVGVIDGGIAHAQWSPDQASLLILTNNDSLILMSNNWEVIHEIPIPARNVTVSGSELVGRLSWTGDGDFFAMLTQDKEDSTTKVRVFSKDMEETAMCRNVADGTASVIKGLGSCVAFSTNGTYITMSLERVKGKLQVRTFLSEVFF